MCVSVATVNAWPQPYGASLVVTPENRRRNATLADYLRIAKLVHSTPLLTLNGGVLVQPADASGELSSLVMVCCAMCLSDKPLIDVQDGEIQVRRVMELCSILSGDENVFKASPQFHFFRGCLNSHPLTRKTMKTRLRKTSVMPWQSWRNNIGVHVCLKKSVNGSMHI